MLTFQGSTACRPPEAGPGEIVLINGIADIGIGVTVTDTATPPLPMLKDEPTLTMNFRSTPARWPAGKASSSPVARSGSAAERAAAQRGPARQRDRTKKAFSRSGPGRTAPDHPAGEHAPPKATRWPSPSRACCSRRSTAKCEPIELVTADIEGNHQGGVMQALGERKGNW